MKVIIIFYTYERKEPEMYDLSNYVELSNYNERIVGLTKSKAKFSVYEIGKCVGDFS